VTVLGLSFKPHTDDLREAPALKAIEFLLAEGAEVKVYDPIVKDKNRLSNLPHAYSRLISEIALCGDPYAAAKGSEALIVVTEWPEFREIDFKKIKSLMKNPNLFDGRNMFKPAKMREAGFKYYGVGR
jgi:UDPglucose 6-dehydrogenase